MHEINGPRKLALELGPVLAAGEFKMLLCDLVVSE
jgi:hypothetical protein